MPSGGGISFGAALAALLSLWMCGTAAKGADAIPSAEIEISADKSGVQCWSPILVPEGMRLTLTRSTSGTAGAILPLTFASTGPVVVRLRQGSDYVVISGEGTVRTLADDVAVRELRAVTAAGGSFVLGETRSVVLRASAGTIVRLDTPPDTGAFTDAATKDYTLEGGVRGAVVGTLVEGSIEPSFTGTLDDETLLTPDRSVFASNNDKPARINRIVDASELPSILPVNSLNVLIQDRAVDILGKKGLLAACVQIDGVNYPAAVLAVAREGEDAFRLTLALPRGERVWWGDGRVAVMLADGSFVGTDHFEMRGTYFGLIWGFAATLVLLGIVWFVASGDRAAKSAVATGLKPTMTPLRWISGPNNKPSLSLFQILLWTFVVVFCIAYVGSITGELVSITQEVLGLLGIAGTGSVVAYIVGSSQGGAPTLAQQPRFSDIFRTDEGFDIYKLQMFIFTVGISSWVVWRVTRDHVFPEIEASLLLLLGISNGVYVASKFAGETPLQAAAQIETEKAALDRSLEARKLERDAGQKSVNDLDTRVKSLTQEIADLAEGDEKEAKSAEIETAKSNLEKANKDLEKAKNDFGAAEKLVSAKEAELIKAKAAVGK